MNAPVLDQVLMLVALLLLASVLLGLVRIWRGPDLADRMLTAQLFGTAGIALLLILGELQDLPYLRNVALILALLAVMASVAFVARVWPPGTGEERETGPDRRGEGYRGEEYSGKERRGEHQGGDA